MPEYTLKLDEPWTFLNVRNNPVEGRRLTFQLADDTVLTIDVTKAQYRNREIVKALLMAEIEAHDSLKAL